MQIITIWLIKFHSVRLEEFAKQTGLSVSHFSELFREQVHQSPLSYFTQLKIRAIKKG